MPTSLSWRQRGRLSTRPGGGMLLKTGGGKFLKNSAATGGMIQKNDTLRLVRPDEHRRAVRRLWIRDREGSSELLAPRPLPLRRQEQEDGALPRGRPAAPTLGAGQSGSVMRSSLGD